MKKFLIIVFMVLLISISGCDGEDGINGITGPTGIDGVDGCAVDELWDKYLGECTENPYYNPLAPICDGRENGQRKVWDPARAACVLPSCTQPDVWNYNIGRCEIPVCSWADDIYNYDTGRCGTPVCNPGYSWDYSIHRCTEDS